MAKEAGLGQALAVGGYDLSGDVGSIDNDGTPRGVFETPSIDKSAMARLLTRVDGALEWTGYFNDAAGQAHAALSGLPTTDVNLLYAVGSTRGKPAKCLVGKQVNYDWNRASDGGLLINVQALANAVVPEWYEMLTAGVETVAAAGNLASVDFGAAGASGMAAMLHIISDGGGITAVNIQSSSDDGAGDAFATIASFTITADNSSERITLSGAVERYIRLNITGSFTNAIIACAMRMGTAEDDTAYT